MNKAPELTHFLKHADRNLIDKFNICGMLSRDLFGESYTIDVPVAKTSSSTQKRKRQSRRRSSPVKTLQDIEGESDVEDAVAAEGFIDQKSGQKVYIIDRVVKYEPHHGYYVHWQGYPKSERTWQLPEDMPAGLAKEMKRARERYRDSRQSLP